MQTCTEKYFHTKQAYLSIWLSKDSIRTKSSM